MRVDSVAQARRMATDVAKPLDSLFSNIRGDISSVFGALGSLGKTIEKHHAHAAATSTPAPRAAHHTTATHQQAAHRTTGKIAAASQRVARIAAPAVRIAGSATSAAQSQVTKLEAQIAQDRAELAATPSNATALKASIRADILQRETQLKAARAQESAAKKLATAQQRAAAKAQAILDKAAGVKSGVQVPSQAVGAQIKMAQLANQLQVAQNSNNTAGQQVALNAQVKLERALLAMDQKRLAGVNKLLKISGLSTVRRTQLLQNRLTMLQEIGNVESGIGSALSSLTSLTGSGSAGSFDLAPGGSAIKVPTLFDVRRAIGRVQMGRIPMPARAGGLQGHPVGSSHVVSVNPTFHITAAVNATDTKAIVEKAVAKMADDIDRGVTGHLKSHGRRAGVRGI
jgi:hypothetical protein